ncbi:hypothetical protein E4U42_003304 [Claviceps africana]|uniref:Uncharacterized protein n=1 Tax=Claviceps africana TaxID=83212 RepID=A0A8K0J6X9_9HYPO|nr:hypothetical protein E4U42_003304 [Claviceps africana]
MVATSSTSQVPTWVVPASEEAEELDEPPELIQKFERTAIRCHQAQPSMLTKAILGESEPDEHPVQHVRPILANSQRRRSMISNVSVASTADLTSDTGMTSPCRTNTPSPPIPEMAALRLYRDITERKETPVVRNDEAQLPNKRRIQFACAAKPPEAQPAIKIPSTEDAPKRPSIKFACAAPRPASTQNTAPKPLDKSNAAPSLPINSASPSTPKKGSALSEALHISPRPSAVRRSSGKIVSTRPKFLRANSKELVKDGSQFHAFASGTAREQDWIRQSHLAPLTKLTIHDTLSKENHFRRLGVEAEEEAEMEEAEEDDEDEDGDDDFDDDEVAEDEEEYDDDSDGYHTDSETGFAESDDEEDGDENMAMWTPSHAISRRNLALNPIRRLSSHEPQSDSSAASHASRSSMRRARTRRIKIASDAPDLPDSTDFVCGTLDEDRPLEEAYLSCLAARRNEKLRIIPQDIDPSFPASDPDNDDEEEIFNPVHHDSYEDAWVQGKMEDLHHGQPDRSRRRKKNEPASPGRKLRSPAPVMRRHHSPPPKNRGRSPKPLFGRQSPRRMRSPAPKALATPSQTPRQSPHVQFPLAGRPGMTVTKSLPRPPALFTAMKSGKSTKQQNQSDVHLRGAIDIVKGLERKRQRRKEKFFQKYCNRARRGQIPERKPQPGRGAERMKELGLLMAGKKDHGNYVLSV